MKKRVVITGMGAITPLGIGLDTFWSALVAGKSGIRKIERFDASNLSTQIAAEVVGFDPTAYIDKKEARRMDRYTQFAVAATGMALQDAGLDLDKENREQIGVIIGSGVGGIETLEDQAKVLVEKGPNRISPFFVPMMIANMAAGQTAITYGLRGPNITTVTACASSTNAVGDAFKLLQRGDAEVMVTGGTEAPVVELAMAGFCSLKAMSTRNDEPEKASRPFDKERDGFVIGEGGAILILETLEHAQARGARIYAEVVGYGTSCDAYHITAPDPEGAGVSRSMQIALADAGLNPVDVDYINAHGTSTPMNDKLESMAIKKVFGEQAQKVAISSTKSMTGHLLGAAGGIEAIVCALTIDRGIIPPTMNYENPDPDCDLDYVPNKARQAQVRIALSNSLAFGGQNATIILKKFE